VKLCEQFSIEAPHFVLFIKIVYMQDELCPNNMGQMKLLVETKNSKRMREKKAYIQLSQLWFTLVNCLHQSITIYLTELTTFTFIEVVCCCGLSEEKEPNNPHMYLPLPKKKKLLTLQLHVQQSHWLLEISILHTIYDHFWPRLITKSWEYGCIYCD
jgi:hypothetical protein